MAVISELTRLDTAIERGPRRLLELQRPDGIWVGELESNVTMTAQHLFWHHYLDLRTPELDRKIGNELMARMRDDGTWSIWFEGPPDLSTSVEAYLPCRLAGVDPGPRALAFIQRGGGIPKSRLFTKCFMALLGQWPWQRMAPIPPELVLLPPASPFSIYDFSCWARQTFVALAVAQSLRPVRPTDIDLAAIGARRGQTRAPRRPNAVRRRAVSLADRGTGEGRRRTAPGAGSSRRGCGGSSPSRHWVTGSTTRCSARRSRAGRASWWTKATGSGPRRASPRSGTRGWPCSPFAPALCPTTIRSSSAPASTSSRRRCA